MKTLVIFNLGGGDLCFRVVDEVLSKKINEQSKQISDSNIEEWQKIVSEITQIEDDNGKPRTDVKKHVKQFFVQNLVPEKKSIEVDQVIYFDQF